MSKLKNVVVLDKKMLNKIAEGEVKVDGRTNNTGRPVNKKSARQVRLNKQAFYANVNDKFVKGNQFKVNNSTYNYSAGKDGKLGCIVDTITGHVCNVSYIGRTKVKGYTFVLGKKVNVELNLKTLQFVK
jgi:16S rRNA U516 pseudouridylate synthase RsuA-like enzyme